MADRLDITRHDEAGAFVLEADGATAGRLDFRREPGRLWIDYVEVTPGFRGQGLGVHLVRAAVAWAHDTGDEVTPLCGYARSVIERGLASNDGS